MLLLTTRCSEPKVRCGSWLGETGRGALGGEMGPACAGDTEVFLELGSLLPRTSPRSPRGPRHQSLPRSSCCLPAMPRDTRLCLNAHQLHGAGFARTLPLLLSRGALCRKKNDTRGQSQEPFGCISIAAGMSRAVLWAVGSPSTMFTDLFVNVCSSFYLGVRVPRGPRCWDRGHFAGYLA